jgi:hypothetical protein
MGMHPMLVLLAFVLAALLTYVLVLGLLTALSIPVREEEAEPVTGPVSDPAVRGDHVRG